MNRTTLVGRLTKDVDLRYTPNGVAVANFTVAVNRQFKKEGEQDADFINCVAWRKTAENLANFMSKGSQVGVDGRIQTRSFDNSEGQRVYVTEVLAESVQFLESKGSSNVNQSNNQSYNGGGQANQQQSNNDPFKDQGEPINIQDDDLPF